LTVSDFERLGERKKQYKGLDFYNITAPLQVNVNVTFALSPSEKASMNGSLSFDRHENSVRYNDEVVISVWSHEAPVIETRAENNGDYRTEIPVPIAVFQELCQTALTRLWNLKSKVVVNNEEATKVEDFL
jgi:hypothetical protein